MDLSSDVASRDPLAVPEAILEARRHSMSERLELALNWDAMADELRVGLAAVIGRPTRHRDRH
ncbi:MAG: hypothetical protein ACRDK4_05890 [Solirubrobacteraceae bacterium]